jgi:hypothetical protein
LQLQADVSAVDPAAQVAVAAALAPQGLQAVHEVPSP